MNKKKLADILSEIFIPMGFKKKGDYWMSTRETINKVVHLQKSKFSDSYYINYGFILNSIPLDDLMMHVFKGLGSLDYDESIRIKELLDFENNILFYNRTEELKQFIVTKVVRDFKRINTEEDLLNELKHRPHLNDIPLMVKKYFKLPLFLAGVPPDIS